MLKKQKRIWNFLLIILISFGVIIGVSFGINKTTKPNQNITSKNLNISTTSKRDNQTKLLPFPTDVGIEYRNEDDYKYLTNEYKRIDSWSIPYNWSNSGDADRYYDALRNLVINWNSSYVTRISPYNGHQWIGDSSYSKRDGFIDRAGFSFYSPQLGKRVNFLNKWGGIREYSNAWKVNGINSYNSYSNVHVDQNAYYDSHGTNGLYPRDDMYRFSDFYNVDLITGYNPHPRSVSNGNIPINEIDYQQLINANYHGFRISLAIELFRSSNLYYSEYGDNDIRKNVDSSLNGQLHSINYLNSAIYEAKNNLENRINSQYPQYKDFKKEFKVSSVKLWIPYFSHKQSDLRSFDVEDVQLELLSLNLNGYVKIDREQYINAIASSMSNRFPTSMKMLVDDGANNDNGGIHNGWEKNDLTIANGGTSTYKKWINQMNEYWNQVYSDQSSNITKTFIQAAPFYNVASDGNSFDLYLKVKSVNYSQPQLKLIRQNIKIDFANSELYENWVANQSFNSRLKIIPSLWFRYDNGRYVYKDDAPEIVDKGDVANGGNNGGKVIYHAPVKIDFTTTSKEDEVLFVNEQKVDVLNKRFTLDLNDEITKIINDDGSITEERKNEYQIKLVKYNQQNGVNVSEKTIFTKTIVIESYINDYQISYFGWNPEINSEQKKLIQEFLLDSSGQPLKDENGNQIKNPNYDPKIDPATGVKKQLVWVNKKVDYQNISFLPDPIDSNGRKVFDSEGVINSSKAFGFLAEAFVIPKGITVSDPGSLFGGQGAPYKYSFLENVKNEWINNFSTKYYGSEETYLSDAGVYIFANNKHKNMSTVKLVGYGEKNSPYDLFTDTYANSSQYGWSPFWDSYQGKHLKQFLIENKKYTQEQIDQLNYLEVIHFWKQYVVSIISKELDPNKKIIRPILNVQKLKEYAKSVNQADFRPSEEMLNSWLGDFEHKDKSQMFANVFDEYNVQVLYRLKHTSNVGNYVFEPSEKVIGVTFKDSPNCDNKEILELSLNKEYVQEVIKNTSLDEFYDKGSQIFNKKLVLTNINVDKIYYAVTITPQNKVKFNFYPFDGNKYCLRAEDKIAYFDNDFISGNGLINIFKEFVEQEFNIKYLNPTTQQIKEKITKFIKSKMNKYVLGKDYVINFPSDEEIETIRPLRDQTYAKPERIVIRLRLGPEAKNIYYGTKDLEVFNYSKYIPNIDNLSKVILSPLEYAFDEPSLLKEAFVKDLNNQLLKYNLELNENVIIYNLDAIIDAFFIRVGKKTMTLKIESLLDGFGGATTIQLTNTTTKAMEVDLSKFKFTPLEMQLTKKEDIINEINKYLNENIYSIFEKEDIELYALINNEEVSIDSYEFLRSLVAKNPPAWEIRQNVIIKGKAENLKNSTSFNIINKSGEQDYDPDKDPEWNKPNKNNYKNISAQTKLKIVGIFTFVIVSSISLLSYRRWLKGTSKKVK